MIGLKKTNAKRAQNILAMQREDGSWGRFHSMSVSSGSKMTTERALRELQSFGYTMEEEAVARAVAYMSDCLAGARRIPDPVEKGCDWATFERLMLATWIRRFTDADEAANAVAAQWAWVVTSAFAGGEFSQTAYNAAYAEQFRNQPRGARLVDPAQFYVISLLRGELDEETRERWREHGRRHPQGIYYGNITAEEI